MNQVRGWNKGFHLNFSLAKKNVLHGISPWTSPSQSVDFVRSRLLLMECQTPFESDINLRTSWQQVVSCFPYIQNFIPKIIALNCYIFRSQENPSWHGLPPLNQCDQDHQEFDWSIRLSSAQYLVACIKYQPSFPTRSFPDTKEKIKANNFL